MAATKTDMTVANEIKNQIGGKALFMFGAKDLIGGENYLMFRIGRNAGNWNKIKIELNSLDLYDVTYYKIRKMEVTKQEKVCGIYCDMLNKTIENETGLASRLF